MSCTYCGHDDWVTISQSKYCAHCGEAAVAGVTAPTGDDSAANAQQPPKLLNDLRATQITPTSRPNPAREYHARATTAPAGALDLRAATPGKASDTRRLDVKAPKPVSTPTPAPAVPSPKPKAERHVRAASIPKSPVISRFKRSGGTVAPESAAQAAPQPVAPEVAPVKTTLPQSQLLATSPSTAGTEYKELPNQVMSQIRSMQNLIPPTSATSTTASAKEPKVKKPKAAGIVAAGMAAAVMAGYIWMNNYDSLTIKAAAQKAGISATAPSYLPASYSLAGPISFGSGFVSMQYKSPSSSSLITLNQRKSDWTASSLLELYVNKQAKTYLSVQTQGLTIYLLDNGQATWVNRGIQYVLQGNSMLNQDQLIKIAESL